MKFRKNKSRKAFTLMEIILVVALLALLMSLVVGNLDGLYSESQSKVAKTFVNGTMSAPLMAYKISMGRYPTTEEGLEALVKSPEEDSRWKGPYIKQLQPDPWGNKYMYACPGEHNKDSYDLWSAGPDGKDGTDDDIGNWVSEE